MVIVAWSINVSQKRLNKRQKDKWVCFFSREFVAAHKFRFPPFPILQLFKIDFSVIISKKIFFPYSLSLSCSLPVKLFLSRSFFFIVFLHNISSSSSLFAYFSLAENVIEVGNGERKKERTNEIGEGEIKCNFLLSSPDVRLRCEEKKRFHFFPLCPP